MDPSITPDMMYDPFTASRENFFKYRLIPALRSGHYKQTDGFLRDYRGFCCLGVMCELLNPNRWVRYDSSHYAWGEADYYLSHETAIKFDVTPQIDLKEGIREYPKSVAYRGNDMPLRNLIVNGRPSLAALNDLGLSFNDIANILEYAVEHNLIYAYDRT